MIAEIAPLRITLKGCRFFLQELLAEQFEASLPLVDIRPSSLTIPYHSINIDIEKRTRRLD
jgi:hypothetical protein